MHRVEKFWRLPFATKILLFGSLMRLATVSVAVHLMPESVARPHWAGFLKSESQCRNRSAAHDRETITWAVAAASGFVPGATCLVQAIVAQRLLLRNGFGAEVKIGVAKDEYGAFAAHAWVISEGKIVLGKDEKRQYSELPTIDAQDHS